jgi:cysteinyl-tRNA synthetase
MANVWMHNGFLQIESEKMSKSLGNFFTIRELLETESFGARKWSGEALRFAMLRTHYRSPIDLTSRALEEAEGALEGWHRLVRDAEVGNPSSGFLAALADDLNTPLAIAELFRLWRSKEASALAGSLELLGIELRRGSSYVSPLKRTIIGAVEQQKIEALIADRTVARARKDFKESDRIRDELAAMGVAIKDSKDGTTWEVAR